MAENCDCPETTCPAREDETHCTHWYDGKPCCSCGDPACPHAETDDT